MCCACLGEESQRNLKVCRILVTILSLSSAVLLVCFAPQQADAAGVSLLSIHEAACVHSWASV